MFRLLRIQLIVLVVSLVSSLYEDQIGLYDWHLKLVGPVRYSFIDRRVLVVVTENSILAGLDIKTGGLLWRHKFTEADEIVMKPVVAGSNVVTYHKTNRYRHWNVMTGVLSFERNLKELGTYSYTSLSSKDDTILRVSSTGISWGSNGDKNGVAQLQFSDDAVFGGFLTYGGDVEAFLYTPLGTGQIILKKANADVTLTKVEIPWATPDLEFVTSDDSIATLKDDIIYFRMFGLSAFRNVILSELGIKWKVDVLEGIGRSVFIARGIGRSAVLAIKDGYMKAVKILDKVVKGRATTTDKVIVISTTKTVSVISNGEESDTYTLSDTSFRGVVKNVILLPSSHNCSQLSSVRVPGLLLQWEDGSITAEGRDAECGWVRDESLATITAAVLVDLPAGTVLPSSLNKHTNPFKMWTSRIAMQLRELEKFVYVTFGPGLSDVQLELERDSFNLNKIIFVVTRIGKIFVLHSTTGNIVWNRYLDNISPLGLQKATYPLHVLRSSSHFPFPPLVAVTAASKDGESTVLTVFNALDGTIERSTNIPDKVTQVQLTKKEDDEFRKILVLLSNNKKVYTYPPHSYSLISDLPLYFTLVYPDTLQIQGLKISGSNVDVTWSTTLNDGKIVAVGTKSPTDEVYTQGRVLGDRSVLHKYINPNVLVVAVETITGDLNKVTTVDVIMYDMVSGTQLYHTRHKQYAAPVHLIVAENWLVYHLWNAKMRRFEAIVAEFFIPFPQNSSEFSSLLPHVSPNVIHQAYITTNAINAMQVTQTLRSITNRDIIVGNEDGRVMAIPKRLLDPRRPVLPTNADKQEQLIPYIPQLVLPPVACLTYNKTIQDIRSILTAPTGLESTSLLFVYGTDLFFTRVTPSKRFDMLNEDFDYYLIGIVLLGLCLGTIATHALADNKALNQKWK